METYKIKSFTGLIQYVAAITFLLCGVECQFLCTSPDICPRHKPYCTTSGCVFECPKSTYVNGTECVAECGNHLVFNKTCVDRCPTNMMLRDTPKILGRDIYIAKLCVTMCDHHEYIYNGTCVTACPVTHKYIHGNNCTTSCPQMTPFIKNITVNGISFYKCVKGCEYLIEDGYCTDDCVPNKYVFNSSCISQCPTSHPFIYNQYCEQTCPNSTVTSGNNTCLFRCPLDVPYIFNNSCVNICPDDSAYIVSEDGRLHCIKKCPLMTYYYNLTCVEKCPNGTFIEDRTCNNKCPNDRPYICTFQNNITCSDSDFDTTPICMVQCPENTYSLGMTCLYTCPSGYKYLNATCVQGCPHEFPFSYDYTATAWYGLNNMLPRIKIEPTCTKSCPDNLYQVNHTCQPFCPHGLYTVDKTCERACPKLKELKRHRSISFEKYIVVSNTWNDYWGKVTKQAEIVECVTACSHNESIFNSTCIKTCPINTFYVNKTCLSECPEYFLFIIQRTKGVKCSASQKCEGVYRYSECLRECPPGTYQFNSTCVDACPDFTFTFGNSCMARCPEYQRFLLKSERTVTQWRQGRDKNWSKISERLNASYTCLEFCPSDKKVHNLTCMDHCPKKSFVSGNECVYECPPESPLEYTDNETWACIRSCDDEYKTFYYNGSCHYSCTAPLIEYDGFCLEKCPPGFLWFNECTRRIDVVIISALILGISIIILAFGRNVVKGYGIVLCKSMSYYLTCKTKDKYTMKDRYGKCRNDCQMPETTEIQRFVGIEMDQVTNSNSNLIDIEQPLHEETNVK